MVAFAVADFVVVVSPVVIIIFIIRQEVSLPHHSESMVWLADTDTVCSVYARPGPMRRSKIQFY